LAALKHIWSRTGIGQLLCQQCWQYPPYHVAEISVVLVNYNLIPFSVAFLHQTVTN